MIFNKRKYFVSVLSLSLAILLSACQKKESSKIIYLLEENRKQNLWSMNADASGKVQITDLEFSVQWPDLSKDGKQIVFSSYDKGFEGLYTISSSGKNLKKLDIKMEEIDIPCWSHDDQNIAFMADRSQGILIADLDGNVIKSVAGEGVGGAYQRWSPIESKLAIESSRDGNSEVYTINPSTNGSLKRLTADDQLDEWPIFSMDGSMIAWAHGGEGDMHTWIMNVDGSNKHLLTDEVTSGDGFASFSPDGSKVLFACWAKEKPSIYIVNIDGSGLKELSEGSHPMWMPK
jgi:TolB protein